MGNLNIYGPSHKAGFATKSKSDFAAAGKI